MQIRRNTFKLCLEEKVIKHFILSFSIKCDKVLLYYKAKAVDWQNLMS